MMKMQKSLPTIPSLTSLRFISALMVLLFHFRGAGFLQFDGLLDAIAKNGYIGVSFFFILSGFILTYNYYERFGKGVKKTEYFSYLRARFARVYPNYFLALMISVPLILYFLKIHYSLPYTFFKNSLNESNVILSLVANVFLLQSYIPVGIFPILWNSISWTISTEFFFYLLLPFILVSLSRAKNLRTSLIITYIVEIIFFLSFAFFLNSSNILVDINLFHFTAMFPLGRIFEFAIGCILCLIYFNLKKFPSLAVFVASVLSVLFIIQLPHFDGILSVINALRWYALYTIFFGLIILSSAYGIPYVGRLLENKYAVLLGNSSYALYIFHLIPLEIMIYFRNSGVAVSNFMAYASFFGIILFSIAIYKYYETPLRDFINKRDWKR